MGFRPPSPSPMGSNLMGLLLLAIVVAFIGDIYGVRADDADDRPFAGLEPFTPSPPYVYPLKTCGPEEATCSNGECVLKADVCNNHPDCSDGSDEFNCSKFIMLWIELLKRSVLINSHIFRIGLLV